MRMRIPSEWVTRGEAATIRVDTEPAETKPWYMIFEHADTVAHFREEESKNVYHEKRFEEPYLQIKMEPDTSTGAVFSRTAEFILVAAQ